MKQLIYVFDDEKTAAYVLDLINKKGITFWISQGKSFNGQEIVNEEKKTLITSWSEIETSPDGSKFYFSSLSNEPIFKGQTEELIAAGLPINEIEIPEEWEYPKID